VVEVEAAKFLLCGSGSAASVARTTRQRSAWPVPKGELEGDDGAQIALLKPRLEPRLGREIGHGPSRLFCGGTPLD
jgi:hypothetical protein